MNDIKKLRDETGLGVMECKRALEEAKGDFDKAKEIATAKSASKVKTHKETACGIIAQYIHNDRVGALVELNCETDFVARMPAFKVLATTIAQQVVGTDPADTEELLKQNYIKDTSLRISDLITKFAGQCNENIKVGRFSRFDIGTRFTALQNV